MYIVANLSSNDIEGTQSEKPVGESIGVNGKFFLATPPGVAVPVNDTSYLIPQDSSSLPYAISQGFLERNPNYDHVTWNFFLETTDISKLDQTAGAPTPDAGNVSAGYLPTMVGSPLGPRFQIGRSAGPAPVGIAPNSIALLPANTRVSGTSQYGSLVTDTLDLTPYNPLNPGTDEVLLWWKIAKMSSTEDVSHGYGITSAVNSPSLRSLQEISPGYAGIRVYASVDDGVTWYECKYLRPKDLVIAGTNLRIAFINEGSEKIFVLGFAVLFPNL